ncbi:Gfo/Idh/MocA family protein [Salinisphaera sp. Q1T1-3]|uniref:Gfo/Idh/MocA family protein n=1 Tax=Salinisphaera sp. Q1T1-3 TaxID=2321229 RepID=UPI000E722C37|nr:Gfo/Idh/MocA family oxidoreductase [Salinisphaera sp. Q1T1-3]RJS93145.1 gfo/Idh/MocA family oxidoreductase [Salinisphaera sp. Q1T1-3]
MAELFPPIRAGMIGGGQGAFIGQVHRMAARLDGDYAWVCGAFSRNADNNQATADGLGIESARAYADWETLIEQEQRLPADQRVQLLVIATPNHLHVPIARAALAAGIHVFSEKPAGIDVGEVAALAAQLDSSGTLYGLAHTYLGYPLVWQAQEMVSQGALGALRKIHVEYPQGWLGKAGDNAGAWRADPAQSGVGGCLADIGTHAFTLAEFISGQKIDQVCAALGRHADARQLDDDADVLFRTETGVSGTLIASQVCTGEENGLKIRLYGEYGGLEWQQMAPNSLIHRRHDAPQRCLRAGIDRPGLYPVAQARLRLPGGHPEGYLEALANLYRDFAKAIHQQAAGTPAGVPGIQAGLRGMAFIEAAVRSHRDHQRWVALKTAA